MHVRPLAEADRRWVRLFHRERLARVADGIAVAAAVSLPWSTSATSVCIVLWLAALLPTIRLAEFRRVIADPAGGVPVALWALAIFGMLWSTAPLMDQVSGIKGFHKLLVIPLLILQFRRSDKGVWVLGGFLLSCTVLLAVSWILHLWPPHRVWRAQPFGVPVKDYIIQSVEFVICTLAAAHLAIEAWHRQRRALAFGLVVLAILFLANVAFVAAGRTALVAFPVLLVLFGAQRFGWKGSAAIVGAGVLASFLAWTSSSYLRERALGVVDEIQVYQRSNGETSVGYRLEFWRKSLTFIAKAPVVGNGTGSIPGLFRRAAEGSAAEGSRDIRAAVTGNPHNLIIELAVQFGLIGAALLFAMWIAHLLMFGARGVVPWLGQGLVIQGVIGALFLSYLLDFTSGWLYVIGIGVLGGTAQRQAASRGDPALPAGALQDCPPWAIWRRPGSRHGPPGD